MISEKRISILLIITFIISNFAMFGSIQAVKADTKNTNNSSKEITSDESNNTTGENIVVTTGSAASIKNLDIVEITDFHGQLLDSKNNEVGAALAKSVEKISDDNPNTLVIGGGDLYQGTPVSNVLQGVPVQKVLSKMGMEVTTLGNHEFDWGLNTINDKTMQGANYEIVCSNLYNKGEDTRPYKPYKIINKNGIKIAVIGAILNDVSTIVLPSNIANYQVKDVANEINACAKEIRDDGSADVVLAVVHDGGSSLNDIVSNLQGVDAVFGGHTHSIEDDVIEDKDKKDIPVLNACNAGKGYIDLNISLDENNKVVGYSKKGTNWRGISVNSKTPLDAECKKIVDDAYNDIAPTFNEVIGSDDVAYSKDQTDSPFGESELGNWMADVVKDKVSADVGIVNNGGIRLSSISKGNVTVGTIFYLMPFDNTITTVNMTGAQLKTIIEQGIADDTGKGLQISGIKIIYDPSKPSYVKAITDSNGNVSTPEVQGERVISIVREKDGTTINDSDVIKVAAPDFVGTGGDNFTEFTVPEIQKTYVDTHILVRDALIENVRSNKKIVVNMNARLKNNQGTNSSTTTPTTMTINQAKDLAAKKGSAILTGFVSGVNGKSIFLQDDTSNPTAGIVLYNTCGAAISKGDKITVTGNLSIYKGLIEITPASISNVTTISKNNTIIPKEITIANINDDLQGELIKVKKATFTSINTEGSSTIQDSTGNIVIFKMPAISELNVNDIKDVTANVSKYGTTMELILRDQNDVANPNESKVTISVVATSDVHGSVLNFDYCKNSAPSKGQGLAKVSTYVNNLRASNSNVMLIDNGDTIQGTPLAYYYNMIDKSSFYPMAKVMGAMKYDTETLGNHEFNYGIDTLNRVINDYKTEGIHVLSANTYENDNSNFVDPYYIKEFNINGKNIKVGILGLTTKCIPNWEEPEHYKGLHFNDIVDEAKKWVPIVKGKGADVVIVAAHSGEEGASDVIPENEIKALANGVSGIDVIIAGHAHSVLNDLNLKNPDGKIVPVVEPGKSANYVSQIDITIDSDKNVTAINTKNVQMDNTIEEDKNITSLIAPYEDKTLKYTSTVIGEATDEFSGEGQISSTTAIMELINKVQAQSANTQLSIAAPLSSTANIPKGNVTIKDIMGTYVYENYLYGVKMNGEEIKKWLEYSARYYKQVSKETDPIEKDSTLNIPDYNLDQLYGATYDIDLTKPAGSRIVNLKYQGKLIKDTDVFTVAINDYRYNGGGSFMKAAGISNTDSSIVTYSSVKALGDDGQVRSLMISYIKSNKKISPTCSSNWKLYTRSVENSNRSHHDSNDSSSSTSNSNNSEKNNEQIIPDNNLTKNNWNKINDKWYYMNEKGEKTVNTWKQIDNQWYCFDKDGVMKTGWVKGSSSKWYYLQENGAMKTGWLLDKNNQWYYLDKNGSMVSGWIEDNNKWYYLQENGTMKTGWLIDKDDQWYYFDEHGEMKTGWFEDSDEVWYYFEKNGTMAKNKSIYGYFLNEKGEWTA